jgi:hypothetical protein
MGTGLPHVHQQRRENRLLFARPEVHQVRSGRQLDWSQKPELRHGLSLRQPESSPFTHAHTADQQHPAGSRIR